MFCNKLNAVTKRSQMHPNTTKPTEIIVLGPMGWMGCVGCEKLQRDFVARTFALIALVQYVLQQVSCSYETIPNAPKYYETQRNIGIGSNGVDWLFLLRKIQMWLRGTNFCNNCTSSPRFAPTFMQFRNDPKCIEILWNRLKHLFRFHQGGLGVFVEKNPVMTSRLNFCINCTSSPRFAPSLMQLRNDPRWTQTLWNAPKHEFRV